MRNQFYRIINYLEIIQQFSGATQLNDNQIFRRVFTIPDNVVTENHTALDAYHSHFPMYKRAEYNTQIPTSSDQHPHPKYIHSDSHSQLSALFEHNEGQQDELQHLAEQITSQASNKNGQQLR